MANKDSVQGLKVIARSTKFDVSPLDQQWDLFIFQDGIDSGYLRVPFTVHPTILKEDREGQFDILGTTLADDMARINYSTVYRPIVQPVNELKDSESIIYKFDFSNLPSDAKVNDINIDLKFDSYAPGDFDMMWLTSPDGKRVPLLQTLGKFGTSGEFDQGGFLDGYDYNSSTVQQQFNFTISSKATCLLYTSPSPRA